MWCDCRLPLKETVLLVPYCVFFIWSMGGRVGLFTNLGSVLELHPCCLGCRKQWGKSVTQDSPFQWQSVFITQQVQFQSAPVFSSKAHDSNNPHSQQWDFCAEQLCCSATAFLIGKGVKLVDFRQLGVPSYRMAWSRSVEGTFVALVHSNVKGDSEVQTSSCVWFAILLHCKCYLVFSV